MSLRRACPDDEPFLWAMLYEASHAAKRGARDPGQLRAIPELSRYLEGWAEAADLGIVGGEGEHLQGAAWVRLLDKANAGYGYVDDDIPELAIATIPAARATGLGTALLTRLLAEAETRYPGVSLSVDTGNPARRLYERTGFVEVARADIINAPESTSTTMLLRFS
ncbi:GNAT family N-acetyltransferase [Nocardia sp. NPDC058633]|uniref:GNAT family N-acetyltransferase n=1 Tax=Nocardia sp. NPDC058633 TaxID=3346568 RepID=UPI003666DF73